jgi:hypothetical protein
LQKCAAWRAARPELVLFEEMAAGMDDILSGRRATVVVDPHVYEPAR